MRLGFVLGFFFGAALASVLSKTKQVEAPGEAGSPPAPSASIRDLSDRLRQQAAEAKQAGREAAQQKREEMLRAYEDAVHRKPTGS